MVYQLVYRPSVRSEDIPKLNRNLRKRIARAIQERLGTEPQQYRDPKRTLKGYWKLRGGGYRLVFRVVRKKFRFTGLFIAVRCTNESQNGLRLNKSEGINMQYETLVQEDHVNASPYTGPQIREDELENIFEKVWVFVGHGSQIPNAGDF